MKVCDLDVAKELHELCKEKEIEIPESSFRWGRYAIIDERDPYSTRHVEVKWSEWSLYYVDDDLNIFYQLETIPAYTLDEVLEIIPRTIVETTDSGEVYNLERCLLSNDIQDGVGYKRMGDCFFARLNMNIDSKVPFYTASADNEQFNITTAACKLAIWLIRKGYLTCKNEDKCNTK